MLMEGYLAVAGFVTVAAVTPGPNNLILLGASAEGGFRAALAPMGGVLAGTLGLLVLSDVGLGYLLVSRPWLQRLLSVAGSSYLLWLGLKMIGAALVARAEASGSPKRVLPRTALGVALFQWLNPKSWIAVLTATAATAGGEPSRDPDWRLYALFLVIPLAAMTVWVLAGSAIHGQLAQEHRRRWFDATMGILLVLSAFLLLI